MVPAIADYTFPAFSCANNIVLLTYSPVALAQTHERVGEFVTMLGLVVSPTQYEAVVVGHGFPEIPLGPTPFTAILPCAFLGCGLLSMAQWHASAQTQWSLCNGWSAISLPRVYCITLPYSCACCACPYYHPCYRAANFGHSNMFRTV